MNQTETGTLNYNGVAYFSERLTKDVTLTDISASTHTTAILDELTNSNECAIIQVNVKLSSTYYTAADHLTVKYSTSYAYASAVIFTSLGSIDTSIIDWGTRESNVDLSFVSLDGPFVKFDQSYYSSWPYNTHIYKIEYVKCYPFKLFTSNYPDVAGVGKMIVGFPDASNGWANDSYIKAGDAGSFIANQTAPGAKTLFTPALYEAGQCVISSYRYGSYGHLMFWYFKKSSTVVSIGTIYTSGTTVNISVQNNAGSVDIYLLTNNINATNYYAVRRNIYL